MRIKPTSHTWRKLNLVNLGRKIFLKELLLENVKNAFTRQAKELTYTIEIFEISTGIKFAQSREPAVY